MVTIKAIRAANSSLTSQSLTAVFAGSTSGIGLATIEALLKSTKSPKIYIVGRSQSKFAPTLAKLQNLNASAKLIFIEAQVSLLKDVHRACATIKAQESKVDLLWVSQGGLSLSEDRPTPEGLSSDFAVKYYSRTLFMHELMPLLHKSGDPRVVSVLAAGSEGTINTTDIGLADPKNYSFVGAMGQGVAITSLAMRELSFENSKVSFIHTYPGVVSTAVLPKLADTMTGYLTPLGWLLKWAFTPLLNLFATTPEDAGEIGLYELTNEKYSASTGKNFFRLSPVAEELGPLAPLSTYQDDGTQKKVWEHTLEVYDKVLSS